MATKRKEKDGFYVKLIRRGEPEPCGHLVLTALTPAEVLTVILKAENKALAKRLKVEEAFV